MNRRKQRVRWRAMNASACLNKVRRADVDGDGCGCVATVRAEQHAITANVQSCRNYADHIALYDATDVDLRNLHDHALGQYRRGCLHHQCPDVSDGENTAGGVTLQACALAYDKHTLLPIASPHRCTHA